MSAEEDSEGTDEWRKCLRKTLARIPADYSGQAVAMKALRHAFHEELAALIAPPLNAYLKTQTQESYPDKQRIAVWVNHELRELGLAIYCGKTKAPAILIADFRDRQDQTSRFRLESRNGSGRVVRTATSRTVPQLDLIEDLRKQEESLSKWKR